jgi:hypothetical protein
MSHFLMLQRKTHRLARDSLRRVLWSVWIWSQQANQQASLSRYQSIVEGLPRHLLEHEKALILTYLSAFGLEKQVAEGTDLVPQQTSASPEIFLNFFIRSFSAMKPFISWNPKTMGINSSTSANLFLTAKPCLVPTQEIEKIIARVFSVSEPEGIRQ